MPTQTVLVTAPSRPVADADIDVATDAITEMLKWSQRIELLIAAGWHDPSIPPDAVNSECLDGDIVISDADSESRHLDVESVENLEPCPRSAEFGDTMYLLQFNRCGGILMQMLHEGRELEQVRMAAAERRQNCKLPSGASIFVYPGQYAATRSIIDNCELRPHHVVIAQVFLPLLKTELASIACRSKVKCRSRKVLALISDDGSEVLVVERTLFRIASHDIDRATVAASI